MEYPNSRPLSPLPCDTMEGLCSNIPVRVHRNAELADRGALRAQKDWQQHFGALPPRYGGTMGPELNFVATVFPETLPDRIEHMGYIVEIAFLADDMIDAAESPTAAVAPHMADLLQAYSVVKAGGDMDAALCTPAARKIVDFAQAMILVDSDRAKGAFRWLVKWVKLAQSGPVSSSKECRNFDEYLEYRRLNVSSHAMFGLSMFGMGLDIPEDQQQICLELSRPFWLQIALANDYHSWEQEQEAAKTHGHTSVTNAIWVLINKHSMTFEEANAMCGERAKQYAAEYLQLLEAVKDRDDLCQDAKYLLGILKFGMSGSIAWSLQCPRYHPDRQLNQAQVEMAKAIWADGSMNWSHGPKKAENGTSQRIRDSTGGIVAIDSTQQAGAAVRDVRPLGTGTIDAPSRYLDSLPAKGIRDKVIDALNVWFKVSPDDTAVIKKIVNLLHGASLMLDDIQDSSELRRGKPATHIVFGPMQTINSAGYRFLDALNEVRKLYGEKCLAVFCDELRDLYIGQSYDLAWTCNLDCPTEEEYFAMIDGKTAGLFRMLARMLDARSDSPIKPDVTTLTRFMTLLGRLFQIRDDYMNLTSADYTKQKGFCEDLDEGKYSLPLIHALGQCENSLVPMSNAKENTLLRNLLAQRHISGRMTFDQKKLFLEYLDKQGSLEYTRQAVAALQVELKRMAEQMGMLDNEKLTTLMEILKV